MIETKYKQTEAGLIPCEWDIIKLGDCFEFKNGLNASKDCFGYGTPIVNYMDVYHHAALKSHHIAGLVNLSPSEIARFRVQKGDVFFTRTSETPEEVGFASVLLDDVKDCVFSGFVLRARPINTKLYPEYCAYCFKTAQVRNAIIKSCSYTTRALTNGKVLSEISIPLPPLAEQKKIAKALSDVDALINNLDGLIAKKRDIKQGTMQQILTGKKRLPGFTDEWKEQTLNDICSLSKGIQLNSSKMNDSGLYPVFNGGIAPSGYFSECNTEANTIIISEGGNSCGFVNYIKEPFWRGGHCYSLSNISIDKVFLYHILKFNEASIMALRTGSGLPNIKKSTLANFCLKNPQSISEQQAIATILTDMDDEIQALEAKRDKYTAIKQGMMQELLTGKIRLV